MPGIHSRVKPRDAPAVTTWRHPRNEAAAASTIRMPVRCPANRPSHRASTAAAKGMNTMAGSRSSSWGMRVFLGEETDQNNHSGIGERAKAPAEERAEHPAQRLGSGLDPSDPASSAAIPTAAETYRPHESGQTLAQRPAKKKPRGRQMAQVADNSPGDHRLSTADRHPWSLVDRP
jgi:hypothetical protein